MENQRTQGLRRPSRLLLCYGLYAVLCQLMGILFHTLSLLSLSTALAVHRAVPMLEHSMMSLVILFAGVLLLELTLDGK